MSGQGKRAVIYVRQSKARQDSISEELQLAACRAHCERMGLEVVREVIEIGVSGFKDWQKRPDFPGMVQEIQDGKYDVLVLYIWSRFSRRASDALSLWNMFEAAGVSIESAAEPMDTSTAFGAYTAKGELLRAEWESKRKSEQFKEIHARRVANGLPRDGRSRYGYDYVDAQHVINPEQAETIRMAFDAYMAGNGLLTVVDQLNEAGRTTARGYPFTINTIFRPLDSGFPFGLLLLDKGKRWEQGSHEPILSKDDWDEYRAERKRRATGKREKPTRDMWELSRMAFCGHCGGSLVFVNRERGYLRCSTQNQARSRCPGVRVKEGEVWDALNHALGAHGGGSHELLHEAIYDATASLDDEYAAAKGLRNSAKSEVEEIEAELGRLASGWASGLLDELGYRLARESASERLVEARERLDAAGANVLAKRPPEGIVRLQTFDSMTPAETNALYRRAVLGFRFFDDRIVVMTPKAEPFLIERETPRQKYPLTEWLDGQEHVLTYGKDYDKSVKTMRQVLTAAAKRRGQKVRVTKVSEGVLKVAPA